MRTKPVIALFKETYSEWSEDKASRLAAALAYYTTFSIAPLLVITIAVVGLFFGRQAVQGGIQQQLQGLLGQEGARAINDMIANAGKHGSGIIATVLGVIALLFGATGVFSELHDALNTIWEVEPKPTGTVKNFVKDRFLSFTLVLGIGFLLLVSLVLSAALAALAGFINALMPGAQIIGHVLNFAVSLGVVTVLFAMMYKVLPDVKISWDDVWIGAFGTAVLFTIGKFLIGLYLGKGTVASSYGAAGALAIVLIWVYYSAQILFFGAEFTQVYARRFGSRIVPAENAVKVTNEERVQRGEPHHTEKPGAAPPQEPSLSPRPDPQPGHPVVPPLPRPAVSIASVLTGVLIGLAFRILGAPRSRG